MICDFAEDDVLAVQPGGNNGRDEKLRSVAGWNGSISEGFTASKNTKGRTHVLGPAFAIDKRPALVCLLTKFSSANFSPYIDFPPVP